MTGLNYAQGEALKDQGMKDAALSREDLLETARRIAHAIALALPGRRCHADLVAQEMERRGLPDLGPAAGSLFKGGNWRFTGERVKSRRTANHARELKVWEYVY